MDTDFMAKWYDLSGRAAVVTGGATRAVLQGGLFRTSG